MQCAISLCILIGLQIFPTGTVERTLYLRRLSDFTQQNITLVNYGLLHQNFTENYRDAEGGVYSFPAITNLGQHLPSLLGSCLVVLNKFRNVPVAEVGIPLMQTSLSLAVLQRISQKNTSTAKNFYNKYNLVWVPDNLLLRLDNVSSNGLYLDCPNSRLLVGAALVNDIRYQDFCVRLDQFYFSSRTKPWSCHVHIDMFPKNLEIFDPGGNPFTFPKTFQYKIENPSFQSVLPSHMSPLNIIILPHLNPNEVRERFLLWWIRSKSLQLASYDSNGYFISHEMFVVFLINIPNIENIQAESNIIKVELVENCFTCPSSFQLVRMANFENAVFNWANLVEIAFPRNDRINWYLLRSIEREEVRIVKRILKTCSNMLSYPHSRQHTHLTLPNLSLKDQLGEAYSHIWMSIMENYTVTDYWRGRSCTNGKVAQFVYFPGGKFNKLQVSWYSEITMHNYTLQFPANVSHLGNRLRFVTCGQRGISSVAFSEFLRSYNATAWLIIVGFMIFIVAALFRLTKGISCWRYAYGVVTLLLEQGDPFPDKVVNCINLRPLTGLFFIMAVILSNAYKNDNIYNMIVLRKPIFYEKFSEILADNFLIYQRVKEISLYRAFTGGIKSRIIHIDNFNTSSQMYGYSELGSYNDELVEKNITLGLELLVRNHTLLHPAIPKLLLSLVETLELLYRSKIWNASIRGMSSLGNKVAAEKMKQVLFRDLSECQKVALILPEMMCHEFALQLKKLHESAVVSIGKESLYVQNTVFVLRGVMTPRIPRRIKGVQASGIWDWWVQFIHSRLKLYTVDDFEHLKKPTMKGNILVVFSIWGIGLILGVSGLLLELRQKLLDNIFKYARKRKALCAVYDKMIACYAEISNKESNRK